MKIINLPILIIAILSMNLTFSQVGIGTTTPENSAALDVESTTRGFLPPRMTSDERDLINNPSAGLIIYNTDDNNIQYFNGSGWFGLNANAIVDPTACPISFTDTRDGQTYAVVEIGSQCWFAENLNYTPPSGNSSCYSNNSANCDIYGRLYDWPTLMNGAGSSNTNPSGVQGLCPSGWHVPSDAEWTELTDFLGGLSVAGGKMKSTTGWDSPNVGATNSSGFTGLPAGTRFGFGGYGGLGNNANFWSSTELSSISWSYNLERSSDIVIRNLNVPSISFSCRCLKD